MRRHFVIAGIGAATALGLAIGCGGGGGGSSSGIIPPANPPTCNASLPARSSQSFGIPGGGDPRIWVPPSSVVRLEDAGVRCHTDHLVLKASMTSRDTTPTGYSPSQIDTAYDLPTSGGSGAIAVVDAFDDPNALSDFNTFSTTFHLPTESSSNPTSSSNKVLQVVYASGTQPSTDGSWAQEISLDTQWSHAIAPGAKIYVVEAASATTADLFTAVSIAKALPGVTQVSMSFGTPESACNFVNYDPVLVQSGVTFFAAGGDTAAERDFPAESSNVVSIGGTTLVTNAFGQWISETAWNQTGCGQSAYEPRPTFQNGVASIVRAYRGADDIAADADPNTGLSVYDSLPYQGVAGWLVIGGTSAATPMIAGMANLAGKSRASSQAQNAAIYASLGSSNFHDITSGKSGNLSAARGWDYPTGVGTPNGLGGF